MAINKKVLSLTSIIEALMDQKKVRSFAKKITIIQVGANDGLFYDPIHRIVKEHPMFFDLLLIEPQKDILEKLKQNYSFDVSVQFSSDLISDGMTKSFYSFKPEYYQFYEYDWSAVKIPDYVNPTGVSSIHKKHLKTHYDLFFRNKSFTFDDVINIDMLESLTLRQLIDKFNFTPDIDILIINAEGEDGTILLNNDWEYIQPKVILYEEQHLSEDDKINIKDMLSKRGYELHATTILVEEILAIHKGGLNDAI